MKPFTL